MVTRPRTHCYLGQGAHRHCQRADYARARDQRDRVSPRTQALSAAESEPLPCATCPPLAGRGRTHHMKGRRMRKKRLSAPERHAIEAALKGEPFPGLVYRRGEFSHHAGTPGQGTARDRKSTRLNSSHQIISYAVFFL